MENLDLGGRLWVALILPWRVLFSPTYGARINNLDALPTHKAAISKVEETQGEARSSDADESELDQSSSSEDSTSRSDKEEGDKSPAIDDAEKDSEKKHIVVEQEADTTAALQLLTILQREGRLVDFLQEEMGSFSDEEIGAAARVVHEGCKAGLKEYIELSPIRSEEEGDTVVLEPGYNASETRITGNVSGEPPYRGNLAHHGWRVDKIKLPKLSADHDARVVAPAEVEL